jgi:hypothetical protein
MEWHSNPGEMHKIQFWPATVDLKVNSDGLLPGVLVQDNETGLCWVIQNFSCA